MSNSGKFTENSKMSPGKSRASPSRKLSADVKTERLDYVSAHGSPSELSKTVVTGKSTVGRSSSRMSGTVSGRKTTEMESSRYSPSTRVTSQSRESPSTRVTSQSRESPSSRMGSQSRASSVKEELESSRRSTSSRVPSRSVNEESYESEEESLHEESDGEEEEHDEEGSDDDVSEMLTQVGHTPEATSLFEPAGDFEYDDKKSKEAASSWHDCLTTAAENLYHGLTFLLGPTIADTLLDAIDYYEYFFQSSETEPRRRSSSASRASQSRGAVTRPAYSRASMRRSHSTLQ